MKCLTTHLISRRGTEDGLEGAPGLRAKRQGTPDPQAHTSFELSAYELRAH
jgi:hypothetical protein